MRVFVGRQPILDAHERTVGYELLFRDGEDAQHAHVVDANTASAQVLTHALGEVGLTELVGDKLAFVNLPRHFLERPELVTVLPHDRVVLEILENVPPTSYVISGIEHLLELGYTFAVDDFVPHGLTAPLRRFASIVKYEHGALDDHDLRREIATDHEAGRRVVIERIETHEDHAAAVAAGADLFQGYYFARASTVGAGGVPTNALALLRLAAQLSSDDASTEEIVDLLTQDVALSVKILRVVNSAAGALNSRVESIHQAAVLIGRERLRAWVALVVLAAADDRPAELVTLALSRAKFCELLAVHRGCENPAAYFTVGMLSLLEQMMGTPMDVIVDQIGVDDTIEAALVDGIGPLAGALSAVTAVESGGRFDAVLPLPDHLLRMHHDAVAWATTVSGAGLVSAAPG